MTKKTVELTDKELEILKKGVNKVKEHADRYADNQYIDSPTREQYIEEVGTCEKLEKKLQ